MVAIGASAGGLEAFRGLLDDLPADTGMAFILVQHLDPAHESLMAELLASHTTMPVCEAADMMAIAPNHVYLIPPGSYLAVGNGSLHLSRPLVRHGARLPFDFLLRSLAVSYGPRAVAVVLSGTGGDGSAGVRDITDNGGLIIAQSPDEAQFDGMPRSAIATGLVGAVLPLAAIPARLAAYQQAFGPQVPAPATPPPPDAFGSIIALLRETTAHNFTLYKPGTLQRRIERRIGLAAIEPATMERYLTLLRHDPAELDLLAKDLLINVTSFFRDRAVFEVLQNRIIPDLVAAHATDQPLRIWVAGCSSGEETYSLAMLFHEHLAAAQSPCNLQIFASDVDPDAVARAREGLYDDTIEAAVTPARLAQFFTREDAHYRISADLRAMVVFAVQDVLADPPFSRLDLVSCRNLLIYLRPEAQAKIIALFHFALRDGGLLLLGSSETIGPADHGFEVVAKAERIYRRTGRNRPGDFGFSMLSGEKTRAIVRPGQALLAGLSPSPQISLAELCRHLVIETYAPAAVLINQNHDCLYTLGPVNRYLQVAPGLASHDLLAMARQGVRTKLRAAIRQAINSKGRVVVAGGIIEHDGAARRFSIDVQPVANEGEALLLICFVETATSAEIVKPRTSRQEGPRIASLERELEATRTELLGAIRDLELSSEDQKTINEEALSINEEFQSTNEELLTSKEELQSLNEELTALNSQLQETLERQRTMSNDLQNVLFSTDVATLFLDTDLHIRFFTPATRALFNVIPTDVGRPLADLTALTSDGMLTLDARAVLETSVPVEREVKGEKDAWFTRRILPYRTQQNGVEGVVITFTDITERKRNANALEGATQVAEHANIAKSRFLAAASHDLRQPLQTLSLLQGLLARAVTGTAAEPLVGRLEQTLGVMTGMLNTLLDINEIEAGVVKVAPSRFTVDAVFDSLRQEFTDVARAHGLDLRVMSCSVIIETDRLLLVQILRNLVSNAIKYTKQGRVLVGCRRLGGRARIEIWDTGIGIPEGELQAIFEEYHQVDNATHNRTLGLGLGLAIVRRLADLLGMPLRVRSRPERGSVFTIEVAIAATVESDPSRDSGPQGDHDTGPKHDDDHGAPDVERASCAAHRPSIIMVVEDDPDIRALLVMFLEEEGYHVIAAADGEAALALVAGGAWPDLVISDYNLPNRMNGVAVVRQVRAAMAQPVPVIILTGDISTGALRDIAAQDCMQFNKPMSLTELSAAIRTLLPPRPRLPPANQGTILVIDDDPHVRAALSALLVADGRVVADYPSGEAFLAAYRPGQDACLLIDADLPGISGLDLLRQLRNTGDATPALMLTGTSDVAIAVAALQAGAADFIEKPVHPDDLLARIDHAVANGRDQTARMAIHDAAVRQLADLSARQREVMALVLAGQPSKAIAITLGISQRTVEVHRAAIMRKTGATSMPALARLALEAQGAVAEPAAIVPPRNATT
ncbi:MAG: chemotaxis protein CheB [Acidiphilium sp.]|nr:chemotaxis protein CheB [Acidiphilium sp.]MDD4934499.1 chemotaxis protein CheB [Acidiphilium sp.]